MEPADIFFWLLLAALAAGVIATIAHGSMNRDSGAGSSVMTALHDFAPADRQRAIEVVVEQKAGKKWMEQESGKTEEPNADAPSEKNPVKPPV